MAGNLGRATFELETDSGKFKRGLQSAEKQAKGSSGNITNSFKSIGGGMQRTGKTMSMFVTAPIVAGFGAAVFSAAKFEKGMAEVHTLLGASFPKKSFEALNADILQLSKETGVATSEMIPALYQAISAGVPPDNVIEFLRVGTTLAIGGVTDLETGIDGLTTITNAWGLSTKDAGDVADTMFVGMKKGKTTIEEMSNFMFQAAPLASALSISAEEVVGSMSALTLTGTPTSVAMTQIKAAMVGIARETPEMLAVLNEAGYASSDLALESLGLMGTLNLLGEGVDGNKGKLIKMLGSQEAVMVALGASGEKIGVYNDIMSDMETKTGAAQEATDIMNESSSRQFDILKNELNVELTKLGMTLLPMVLGAAKPLIKGISALLAGFSGLPKPLKFLVLGVVGLVAIAGPLLLFFGTLLVMLPLMATGFGILTASVLPLLLPILAVVAVVIVLAALAFLIYKNWGAIKKFFKTKVLPIFGKVKDTFNSVKDTVIKAMTDVKDKVFKIVGDVKNFITGAFDSVLNFLKSNWPEIAAIISGPFFPLVALATDAFGIRSAVVGAFESVLGFMKDNWPEIAALLSGPFFPLVALATDAFGIRSALLGAFSAITSGVITAMNETGDAILNALLAIPALIADAASAIGKAIVDLIMSAIKGNLNIAGAILDAVPGGGIVKSVGGAVGGAVGGIFGQRGIFKVPGTGRGDTVPSMLEPGEMVLPRNLASAVRAGAGAEAAGRGDINIQVYNPKPEAAEDTVQRRLLALSQLGVT